MNEILDLFYNEILKEAAKGRVDCNMMYNILFKTKINGKTLYNLDSNVVKNNSLLIPTLTIDDVDKFNESLINYYNKAKEFYKNMIDKEDHFDKTILTLLWNNLTEDDFKNPVNYINRYIDFMDNPIIDSNEYVSIGHSDILDSDIEVCLKKEPINEETPYGLYIRSEKDNLYYEFPVVRMGISNDEAYIYAVQQKKNKALENEENYNYEKNIHRKLFRVNDGFLKEDNSDNINNPENITGISPSALVALTIALSLLEDKGINKIEVPTFLPVRYNAKEISYMIKKELLEKKGYDVESINNIIHEYESVHEGIQRNLSDKFLRYFRRLEYNFDNINLTAYPYDIDTSAHMYLDNYSDCNNILLKEMYELYNSKEKQKNK